ncbi:MAG: NYN domain-containing protein [Desulfatiglans sp.]|nr:NYN domain-containing protein [Desulfatiglans sp.]
MRTAIYVDGFNLYYRALKGTPYKWLDIKLLVSNLLQPQNKIIGLLSPVIEGHPSNELQKYAHFVKRIRKGVLEACFL